MGRPDSGRSSVRRIPVEVTAEFLETCSMPQYIKARQQMDAERERVGNVAEAVSVTDEKGR